MNNTPKSVLFVCTGNTCRSPMAETIFNDIVNKDKYLKGQFQGLSAGTEATPGSMASKNAITVLKEMGVDLSNHKSQQVSQNIVSRVDFILTMTNKHKNIVGDGLKIDANTPLSTLKSFAYDLSNTKESDSFFDDISDPYEKDEQVYYECQKEIRSSIESILNKIAK